MRRLGAVLSAAMFALTLYASSALAQAEFVAPAAKELVAALKGFTLRAPARGAADALAEAGGGAAVEALSARVMREGGEAALKRAARLVQDVGPVAVASLAKVARPAALLEALDGLPADVARKAVNALGRGPEGQVIAEAIDRFGASALRLELQHPGVGTKLARDLGESGIALAERLPTSDAILLARRSEEIGRLPEATKQALLQGASRRLGDFVKFLANNPKFTFTAAATTVLLAKGDEIFGGSQIATDADGHPISVARPGFLERFARTFLEGIAASILAPVGTALALLVGTWGVIRLWFVYRRQRARERRAV